MVPRRKLINQGDAKVISTATASLESDVSCSRSITCPIDDTPTSNCRLLRARIATQAPKPPANANNAGIGLNGSENEAAANSAAHEASTIAAPTRRHWRARDDACSVVHGTSNVARSA
jgi:hypothetical protein